MSYKLQTNISVNGKEIKIRTDYRDVLNVLIAMNDPDLKDSEKAYICLFIMLEDFESLEKKDYKDAFNQIKSFIDYGMRSDRKLNTQIVDFEQDEPLLISAINKVAGREIRNDEYLHWWTFIGYYMEIGECIYSTVLSIRSKKAKNKQLEKWEEEFFRENRKICIIEEKLSEEEIKQKEKLNQMLK